MANSTSRIARTLATKNTISISFLEIFHECFARYRLTKERNRLLDGISSDKQHRKMTVRSAVLLVCCIAAAREWRTSETRLRNYHDARWRSEEHPLSRARIYDVDAVRKQSTLWEINRVEALAALSFSHQAGYSTHSRTLWSCIEGALRTDALGEPPRVVRSLDDVNEHFEKIRLRLYHQRKLKGDAAVAAEAGGIHRELLLKLRDRSLKDPRDELLLKALHRAT
jgi:hypothetical protein